MGLGLAAIDITANLIPFKQGLAKARQGVSKFTKSTSDSVSLAMKRTGRLSEGVAQTIKKATALINRSADSIRKRYKIALGRASLSVDIFKDRHRLAFMLIGRASKRTALVITSAFKASFRAVALSMRAISKSMPFIKRSFTKLFSFMKRGFTKVIRTAKLVSFALLGIGIASVKIASDVIETENLFRISMGGMADSAERWARDYSKSLGLFELDTKKAVGTFQLILTSMGLAEDQAFEMSKGLAQLTNDISSFRNIKPEEVFLKLQGGITGEIRPLRNIGILINETTIKALALKDANIIARLASDKAASSDNKRVISLKKQIQALSQLGKSVKSVKLTKLKDELKEANAAAKMQSFVLTEVEKVMLRYKAVVNATRLDMGDMKRTLDDTANVFRVIWAQVKVTGQTIGEVFIPIVTEAAIAIRQFFVNNQPLIKQWAEVVLTAIQKVIKWVRITIDLLGQGRFKEVFTEIGRLFGILINRIISILQVFVPLVAKIGSEAGTAFADGFIRAVEGTKLGSILKGIGKGIDIATAFPRAQGRLAGAVARPFLVDRPAQLSKSAQDQLGNIPAQQLQELKRINQRFADQGRDF